MNTENKLPETKKKLNLKLEGLEGSAFNLMGAFVKQAKREGWTTEEIAEVIAECKEADYDNLLQVLIKHCK